MILPLISTSRFVPKSNQNITIAVLHKKVFLFLQWRFVNALKGTDHLYYHIDKGIRLENAYLF